MPLNVLVSGASIAGPTAAYWLAKGGAKVTVIERFPELRTGGQNVDIRTLGVEVMRQMPDMEEAVRATLAPIDGFAFVNDAGKTFATMKATGNPDQQSLVSEYEIFRGDLSKIIVDLTKDDPNVNYIFNEQITAIDHQDDGTIDVTFLNGTPRTRYDLVVACDGSTSRTRAMGLGIGKREHVVPLNSWAAFFSVQQDFLKGNTIGECWCTTGGRFLGIGPDHEKGVNRVIVMSIHPRNDKDATEAFRAATAQSNEALKQVVIDEIAGAGWKSDEIVEELKKSDDFYASEMVQLKLPNLSKGNFVTVGDAGYAAGPTGGGTSLALAGAFVLAGEVKSHPGDIRAALKSYEERMKPIIADLQTIPPGFPGVMAPQTRWRIILRNIAVRIICWSISFGSYFSWVLGFLSTATAKSKHALPDYQWKKTV